MTNLDQLAEKAAGRIAAGGSVRDRLQDALLILLGFDVPHLIREAPRPTVKKEAKRVSLREGFGEFFNKRWG